MTHVGTLLTAKGVKPIVKYQQAFKNTYLYGSFSPIDGSNFIWEVEGVDTLIFEAYLKDFSVYRPDEFKIVVIDNAGFHSTQNIEIPENIALIRIPPYTPELNPAEKIWQYLKERFKNKTFGNIKELKKWLHQTVVEEITKENVISIVKNELYNNSFKACFNL
jgi:transposase